MRMFYESCSLQFGYRNLKNKLWHELCYFMQCLLIISNCGKVTVQQTSVIITFRELTGNRAIQSPDKNHTYVEFGLPEYNADTCEAEDDANRAIILIALSHTVIKPSSHSSSMFIVNAENILILEQQSSISVTSSAFDSLQVMQQLQIV